MKTLRPYLLTLQLVFSISFIASGQWFSTEGPYGGSVFDLAQNENYIFAAAMNGVYKSSNVGGSWEKLENGIGNHFSCGLLSINQNEIIGRFYDSVESGKAKIFYSDTEGDLWQEIPYPDTILSISDLIVCDHGIYLSSHQRVYRTTDLGTSWEYITPEPHSIQGIVIFDNKIFISWGYTAPTIFYSDTLGEVWTSLESPFSGKIVFVKDEIMVFGENSNGLLNFSHDFGQTWNESTFENWSSNSAHHVLIDTTLYVSQQGIIWKTTDWGHHFTQIESQPYTGYGTRCLANVGNIFIKGTFGYGAYRSFDFGNNWEEADSGFYASSAVNIYPYNDTLFEASNYEGLSKYVNNQFSEIPYPVEKQIYDLLVIDDVILTSIDFNILVRSENFGETWHYIHQAGPMFEPGTIEKFYYYEPYIYGISRSENAIARSTNYGSGWEDISAIIEAQTPFYFYSQDFVINNGILFAASHDVIAKSEDNGTTWTTQPIDINVNSIISDLYSIDSVLFMEVWDASPTGILLWRSFDNGETWEDITMNLPGLDIQSGISEFTKVGAFTIMSLGNVGIFVSLDYGLNWIPFSEGLGTSSLSEISVIGDLIYGGSGCCGVWKRSLRDLDIFLSTEEPKKFGFLKLKFSPNPSEGMITFFAQTEQIQDGRLFIYNMEGRLFKSKNIKTRIPETIDLTNLQKGVYFLQVKTKEKLFTGKVILE